MPLPPPATGTEHRWPCAQCGAQLRFAPGQTELVCDHCGHVQTIPQAGDRRRARALHEHDLAAGLRDDLPVSAMQDVRTTTCTSCGAQIEFRAATHATQCPFCASPVALDSGSHRLVKPQALVPFALTQAQARAALITWLGNRWFAPSTLLEYARKGRAMDGIYVPFWTFDAATQSDYSGQRGEHYYETEMVRVTVNGRSQMQPRQVRKTRWYAASGHVARDFDDVLVMGSASLPARLGNELTPWDLSALVPYDPDFLAGFTAEGYTVALTEADAAAKAQMATVIERDVRRDIGGDEQRVHSVDTRFSDETFKHILLPVWMAAYKYNGKSFRFLVNGQTGEVQGERPWSAWKIAFAVLLVALLALGAVYLNDPANLGLPRPDWMN
ncbi:primosomal protein N' (replication factor Y) - superfamily II helicase [Rhodobacter sp. Har01]|uniref:primosomal protein N' (replication factor Y) - superfamily II helicase n=1 Tax=Rhodobacter sp. Har01 TaxID=2883999 RepID=UPI001D076F60|nr:primosomal protein N' (replication factor Y) - superfamily II helicase [Rhodobacter sp. Har01]MCB6178176.1 primosomal protein N' (replication factor Y) - superfamily II helicase [Rhodobacter sp. Har01]